MCASARVPVVVPAQQGSHPYDNDMHLEERPRCLLAMAPKQHRDRAALNKSLTRAYNRRFKTMDGSACYRLGLFHEHRAEAIALELFKGNTSGLLELEWADAMRSADACFRNALQQGVEGAAASICKLHQIQPGQRRPFYPGDEVSIHGLVSNLGEHLNGHKGVIVSHVASSGRFGVQIDGCGLKYIRPANLTILDSDDDFAKYCVRGSCACDSHFVRHDAC